MKQKAKPARAAESRNIFRDEWFLGVSLATVAIFYFLNGRLDDKLADPLWLALVFIWLFGVVMGSALNVVRHADHVSQVARRALWHAGAHAVGHRNRSAQHLGRDAARRE